MHVPFALACLTHKSVLQNPFMSASVQEAYFSKENAYPLVKWLCSHAFEVLGKDLATATVDC